MLWSISQLFSMTVCLIMYVIECLFMLNVSCVMIKNILVADIRINQCLCKASLTSHRTCTYVLGTEKNRLLCKGHLSYPCNFITEYHGRTDPTMKIGMHIFFAYTQYSYKHIHVSRVTYERLAHVQSPC